MNLESLPPGACIDPVLYPELTEPKRFVRIEYQGTYCICKPDEAQDMIELGFEDEYTVTDVFMTQQEFDALPEFMGF
jgi:hypothetical protein